MKIDRLKLLACATLCLPGLVIGADALDSKARRDAQLFANVGPTTITVEEYNKALQMASRRRFYHGTPPEGAIDQLRQDVAHEVITRELLLQEAARLGLKADEAAVSGRIEEFDRRYGDSARWRAQRETLVESLTQHYREQDLLQQLEAMHRRVEPPDRSQLLDYYQTHQGRFTEPAQHRISVILLRVDPSSPKAVWDSAEKEGAQLVSRIREGADFSELARLHSADATAAKGGDMGYLHTGMLSPLAEEVISKLQPGDISAPVRLLEGIAILRLDDRKPEQLRSFEEVSERARELWLRENSNLAWKTFQEGLWEKTEISIHDELVLLGNRQ